LKSLCEPEPPIEEGGRVKGRRLKVALRGILGRFGERHSWSCAAKLRPDLWKDSSDAEE
jgi:hypothetical protein